MSESKQSEAFDEEIIVLTDADGVAHRVVPVLTAQGGDAYYFYFYEADDTGEEGPELCSLKLRKACIRREPSCRPRRNWRCALASIATPCAMPSSVS